MLDVMTLRAMAVATAAVLVLTACSGGGSTDEPDPGPSERDAAEVVRYSPLTGLVMKETPNNPVFVVKIENTANGAPQTGLDEADLVVEELVEGGLTRLAAMYYSNVPERVGHVRSLRITDIGIAMPVNGAIVATGGANQAVNRVANAGVPVFSEDGGSAGFSSDPAKYRPYNRWVNLQTIAANAEVTAPTAPFLPWAEPGQDQDAETDPTATPSATTAAPAPATKASVRFSRSVTTKWKRSGEHWTRTNGYADPEFRADHLIVMFCRVGDAGYTDPAGNPVPSTELEGSGRAVILQSDGTPVELTWKKPAIDSPISFERTDGTPYTLSPGRAFIELVPKGDGSVDFS